MRYVYKNIGINLNGALFFLFYLFKDIILAYIKIKENIKESYIFHG